MEVPFCFNQPPIVQANLQEKRKEELETEDRVGSIMRWKWYG